MSDERSQLEAWGLHDHMHYENGVLVEDTPTEPVLEAVQMATVPEVEFSPIDFLEQRRQLFYSNVQQRIEASEEYPVDEIWQEDYMLEQLDNLAFGEFPIISEAEHMAIFAGWISKRRPDTAIIKVTPQPRGYGRGYLNE